MSPIHHYLASWIPWLLTPLMVLAGMQGGMCCCDEAPSEAQGHCESRVQPRQEHDHAEGHSHQTVEKQACSEAEQSDPSCADGCDSHEGCDCGEFCTLVDQVAVLASPNSAEWSGEGLLALASTAVPLGGEPLRLVLASVERREERNHSPPLFLLYCTFIC